MINLDNLSGWDEEVGYGILQVHAFIFDVSLALNETLVKDFHRNGSNLGVVVTPNEKQLFVHNHNYDTVFVAISMTLYDKHGKITLSQIVSSKVTQFFNVSAPIPGNCNLHAPIFPMLELNIDLVDQHIEIRTPPAFDVTNTVFYKDFACGNESLTYESVYMALEPFDYSMPTYFENLEKMMSGQLTRKYNLARNFTTTNHGITKHFGLNPGTGLIFSTYVIGARGYAMYVPIVTYSCYFCRNDSKLSIKYTSYPSTTIVIIGILQIVGGILIGWMDIKKLKTIYRAESSIALVKGNLLGFFILRNIEGISDVNFARGVLLIAFTNMIVIHCFAAGPRMSLAFSDFSISFIAAFVMCSIYGDIHTATLELLMASCALALILTMFAVLPYFGPVVVVVVGTNVVVTGANSYLQRFLYDFFMNPSTAEYHTMADMVY
jgi:hypothetical protein